VRLGLESGASVSACYTSPLLADTSWLLFSASCGGSCSSLDSILGLVGVCLLGDLLVLLASLCTLGLWYHPCWVEFGCVFPVNGGLGREISTEKCQVGRELQYEFIYCL